LGWDQRPANALQRLVLFGGEPVEAGERLTTPKSAVRRSRRPAGLADFGDEVLAFGIAGLR
jgi:hypothetical protein